jgi:hypothetical protein
MFKYLYGLLMETSASRLRREIDGQGGSFLLLHSRQPYDWMRRCFYFMPTKAEMLAA